MLNRFILIFFTFSLSSYGSFIKFDPREIVNDGRLARDAADIVTQLGLNCAQDPRFVAVFIKEFWRILSGIARIAAESTQMTVYKKGYPNICHVMTQSHINSYSEGKHIEKETKCSLKSPTGGCLLKKYITKERPSPSYYWPLYFIEVTEKGNDPHHMFAQKNLLYSLNRKIAKVLEKYVDQAGAVKLTSLVMGGKHALSSVGMTVNKGDLSDVGKIAALTPFEKLRIRSSKKNDMKSFDVSIWPVALGELVAKHFSVCGPVREQRGQRPGGYTWGVKGVPMTCPIALTNDAFAFWDTGMLDYMDPEALSAMGAGSNPLTCGMAQGANYLSSKKYDKRKKVGNKKEQKKRVSSLPKKMQKSLNSCSFPILGEAHGVAKQALSLGSSSKWSQLKCTLWGSVAPRMSTSVFENDYSYANTALKFKLFSHDLFSLPRGENERWSLAYPWEDKSITSKNSKYFEKLQEELKDFGVKFSKTNGARSHQLMRPGSPYLVNMSSSLKYAKDVTSNWGREIAYLSGLSAASIGAREAMEKSFRNTNRKTTPLKREVIWKKKKTCEWGGRKFKVKSDKECFGYAHNHTHQIKYLEKMYKSGYKKVKSPLVRKYKTVCKNLPGDPYRFGCSHPRVRCLPKLVSKYRVKKEEVSIPSEDPRTVTKNSQTQKILLLGASAAPWVASEVARNSLSEMTGYNPIKGDRRIYTIWEKIDCIYPSIRRTTRLGSAPEFRRYDSCESAIRFEVYKYIQTKFLRKVCNAFGSTEGLPWK